MKPGKIIEHSGSYELHQRVSASTLALSPLANFSRRGIQEAPVQTAERKLELVKGDIPENRLAQAESFHQVYRSQSGERMEALRSLYQELGEPQNLVITLFCKKYFPLFKNWLLSCDRSELNPRDNTIAFCLDGESAQRATSLGIQNYLLDPEIYTHAGGARKFADESFRVTMLYKNAIILDALELGASILFQDADMIWFKDPFSHLNSHGEYYDVQIMYDGPNKRYRPIYCNSGFIYIRPNDTTKALFETALRNSACILKSGGHQYALVRILDYFLDHQLLRLHILPEHLFMNGHLFNTNGGIRPNAKNWRKHGIVFHYSWSLGIQEKFDKLERFDMCFLDPRDILPSNSYGDGDRIKQETQNSKRTTSNEIVLLLHVEGEDPLELICDSSDPILRTLLEAFFSSQTEDGKNSLIHLRITENNEPCDLFIRASKIKMIKTIPPLNVESIYADEPDIDKSANK